MIKNTLKPANNLEACVPQQRIFPNSWKVAYWRISRGPENGYECPICHDKFYGSRGFSVLHADHIIPFSKGGETVWENMQLLCGKCNLKKFSNYNGSDSFFAELKEQEKTNKKRY